MSNKRNNSNATNVFYWCLLLFSLISLNQLAQGGFKKNYPFVGALSGDCGNVIETPEGNYIGLGTTQDTINTQLIQRLTAIGTNSNGDLLWKKSYGQVGKWYYSNIEQGFVDSSGFYQAVVMQGYGPRAYGALIKFNFQGDTVWQKIYALGNFTEDLVPTSLTKSKDGGFLITGYVKVFGGQDTVKLLLMKTDASGNLIWRKKIISNVSNWQNVIIGYGIIEDSASKRILISGMQYLGTLSNYTQYASVFCADSLGNILWNSVYGNKSTSAYSRVIRISDGNFMTAGNICSNYDSDGYGNRWKLAAVKFNINGDLDLDEEL